MNTHCQGCKSHHNANHPRSSPAPLLKFNDWCCRFGKHAQDAVGHCKLTNGKNSPIGRADPSAASRIALGAGDLSPSLENPNAHL